MLTKFESKSNWVSAREYLSTQDRVPWGLGTHVLSTADQCYLVLGLFRPLKSAQLLIHYA